MKNDRERLRESYRPERVRVLFVGEAPPASGAFFYRRDSGLYRALSTTFEEAFPRLRGRDFLAVFCDLGCYLVDLCGRPVDRLEPRERKKVRRMGEARLAETVRRLRPLAIVVLLRSINENSARAEGVAAWSGVRIVVPYPGRWVRWRDEFREILVPVLRRWKRDETLGRM
ncbi:MAG: hypothetical protein HY879_26505 [Deltaproteobacteria bacterium]|nr:hypothetical protein [Deltaproteobacteria bacterium]